MSKGKRKNEIASTPGTYRNDEEGITETERDGTPGQIRTADLLIRSQTLYLKE